MVAWLEVINWLNTISEISTRLISYDLWKFDDMLNTNSVFAIQFGVAVLEGDVDWIQFHFIRNIYFVTFLLLENMSLLLVIVKWMSCSFWLFVFCIILSFVYLNYLSCLCPYPSPSLHFVDHAQPGLLNNDPSILRPYSLLPFLSLSSLSLPLSPSSSRTLLLRPSATDFISFTCMAVYARRIFYGALVVGPAPCCRRPSVTVVPLESTVHHPPEAPLDPSGNQM